jgi:hypothetical protein
MELGSPSTGNTTCVPRAVSITVRGFWYDLRLYVNDFRPSRRDRLFTRTGFSVPETPSRLGVESAVWLMISCTVAFSFSGGREEGSGEPGGTEFALVEPRWHSVYANFNRDGYITR